MADPTHDPQAEYERRLAVLRAEAAHYARRFDHIANGRLAVFGLALLAGAGAWWTDALSWWWLAVPLGAFVALAIWHERTARARARVEAAITYYERGLRRISGDWPGDGNQGNEWRREDHGYAGDLDLFGEASLFELLCQARTEAGERCLATWLLESQDRDVIEARQVAVQELTHCLALREELGQLAIDVRLAVRGRSLSDWARQSPGLPGGPRKAVFVALTACSVLALVFGLATQIYFPVLILLVVQLILLRTVARPILHVVHAVDEPARELHVLGKLLERMERETFRDPLLKDIQARLTEGGLPVSTRIRTLERLVFLFDLHLNQLFAPVAVLLMWGVHLAFAIERWRMQWGKDVPQWLEAVGEFEALLSLSAFAYEHPAYPYPEIDDSVPAIDGRALAHPLLKPGACVPNDVQLGGDLKVVIVSGSNMSGKSTYLRTVGINVVLAQLGAPVCAVSLRLAPVWIGATLRVQDSIQDGVSRFYAELQRLKIISDAIGGGRPVLFLLDEILHGTNSHDRQIGAEALVKSFIARGAIGFVTTHDLALTRAADAMGAAAANVHFSDTLDGGRLRFDYTMRPGVVDHSNALQLMENLGLLPDGAEDSDEKARPGQP